MSNQLYSISILAEANIKNTTAVLGNYLDESLIMIDPGMDAESMSLFRFDFTTGSTTVASGYDSDTATYYS